MDLPSTGTSKSMMPFTLKELVIVSKCLLDVIIGLVQMMFSDTRANVVAAYGKAMLSVGAGPLGHSAFDAWSNLFQVIEIRSFCVCICICKIVSVYVYCIYICVSVYVYCIYICVSVY